MPPKSPPKTEAPSPDVTPLEASLEALPAEAPTVINATPLEAPPSPAELRKIEAAREIAGFSSDARGTIATLEPRIIAARASLERADRELGESAETNARATTATREAARAYADDTTADNLETHRRAKVTSTAAAASHARAEEVADAARTALHALDAELAAIVEGEREAARKREREAARKAALEAREKETAADRAHLRTLAAGLGRQAFMVAIGPAIEKLTRARRDIEAALVEIRAERDAQPARYAEALALHTEIGEPAPASPPAPVGDAAERIAYVLASQALGEAYEGTTAEDLAEWIAVRSFASEADRARWAFGRLGVDYGPGRQHTDPTRALDLLLVHGRDLGREAEGKAALADRLAGLAAIVETHRDPVFKARAAVHELAFSLPDLGELGRAPERLERDKHLREIILAGAHALACWDATGEAKKSAGRYKLTGERGIVEFSRVAPDGKGNVPDALAFALGVRAGADHEALRGFLGIAGKRKLADLIPAIPESPAAA